MALTRYMYDEITTRPTEESALNYLRTMFASAGWVEDKVVQAANRVTQLYVHSAAASDMMYLSFDVVDTTNRHEFNIYANIGFDGASLVSDQPNSLNTTLSPPVPSLIVYGKSGRITMDCFIDSTVFYGIFFMPALFEDGTTYHYRRTSENYFYAGTLGKFMPFSGGQFVLQAVRSSTNDYVGYNGCYFEGQWFFSDVNKADGFLAGFNKSNKGEYENRGGNLRTGSVILTPFVQYIDSDLSKTSPQWVGLGQWPFIFKNRYGMTWNKTYSQDGRDYFSKYITIGEYKLFNMFDITP